MKFIVDTKKKIILGWSAKCGCSSIKTIYWFLQTDNLNTTIHSRREEQELPSDINNYTTLVFIRNPYERLVSGFLDKYKRGGQYRNKWKFSSLSFSQFVDRLINYDWVVVDRHHFTPQTTEDFDEKIQEIEKLARGRLSKYKERAVVIKNDSASAATELSDGSLDFVFIDANHKYAYVKRDIEVWYGKVRSGGLVSGHDYMWSGVSKAVNEFIENKNLDVYVSPFPSDVWYCIKR